MIRQERAAIARQLKNEGKLGREIAGALGISRSYAQELLADPDGSRAKARKHRYSGTCQDCGAPTCGGDGRAKAPKRCAPCQIEYQRSDQYRAEITFWTRARLIAAIQDWAAIHGEPPAMPDWSPWTARRMGDEARAQQWERARPRWPWFTSVIHQFGTWNTAIAAAGFTPRVPTGGGSNALRRRRKTHCKYKHPFTEENTYIVHGHRYCRACARRRSREYARRKRVTVSA
jgi:hypothetical protein